MMDLLNKTIVGTTREPSSISANISRYPSIQIDGSSETEPQHKGLEDLDAKLKTMQSKIFIDVVKIVNLKIRDFFQGDELADKVEAYVGDWLTEMNTTQHDASQLNESVSQSQQNRKNVPPILEERLASLEEKVTSTINPAIDKAITRCESLEKEVTDLKEEVSVFTDNTRTAIKNLSDVSKATKVELSEFIQQADANLATYMQEKSTFHANVESIQENIEKLYRLCDEMEQYSRREICVFKDVAFQHGKAHLEDTTQLIVNLVTTNLGLNINRHDISVCHRQHIPGSRKSSYPPIYCKFVNRCLARKVVARSHCFKFRDNPALKRIKVEENLTHKRRIVYENALADLKDYKFKWVKNGSIFVRKSERSKAHRVNTQAALDELVLGKAQATNSTVPSRSCEEGYAYYSSKFRSSALSCIAFPPLIQGQSQQSTSQSCDTNARSEGNDSVAI